VYKRMFIDLLNKQLFKEAYLSSSYFINHFIIQFNCLVFSQLVSIDNVLYIVLAGQKSSCFSLEPDP